MPAERLSMRKIQEVLRLQAAGHSQQQIAHSCEIGRSTVGEYLQRARRAGLGWPPPEGVAAADVGAVLAAGFSRCFGANKLLQPLADGAPLALAAARHLRAALPGVLAAVHPHEPELARWLERDGFPVSVCPRAPEGMGASLAWAVSQTPRAFAWIIALVDMPFIQPATVVQVADAIEQPTTLAAPVFRGR